MKRKASAISSPSCRNSLYDQAALAEGGQLSNPTAYVQRLNRVLIRLAGVQPERAD